MSVRRSGPRGEIAPFDRRSWAVLLSVWTALNLLCARRIYPALDAGFWSCFLAAQARALLAACLSVLLAHALGRRFGAWGRRLPAAAFLLLTAFSALGAALFAFSGLSTGLLVRVVRDYRAAGLWTLLLDTGIPLWSQAAAAAGALAALAGGLRLQELGHRRAARLKTRLRAAVPLALAAASAVAIVAEQAASPGYKSRRAWVLEQSAMPLYAPLRRARGLADYDVVLSPFRRDDLAAARPREAPAPRGKIRTVVLVVLESVREDSIDADTAPNLARFKSEALRFQDAYANGNGTVLSWYAIFDAHFPYYVLSARTRPDWAGSPAFRILRDAGYRTEVFSAPSFQFFDYRRVAFGPADALAEIHESDMTRTVPERDRQAARELMAALSAQGKGPRRRFYALLLDSTHSLYSWPADFPAKFTPYADDVENVVVDRDFPARLRNRYKNALRYDDSLFGELVARLKALGLYRDAAIVVVADHGEEFMEHGGFAHGSTLYGELVRVPLYLKLPGVAAEERPGPVSQVDILPTVLDALGLDREARGLTDGRSVLSSPGGPALTFALPDAEFPDRALLSTGRYRVEFRLSPGGAGVRRLTVWDIRDRRDGAVVLPRDRPADVKEFLDREFVPALNATGLIHATPP